MPPRHQPNPIWEQFNRLRQQPTGDIPLEDFIAIIRGNGMDRPSEVGAIGVPGELGRLNPNECPGNWGNSRIIRFNPSQAEIDNNILPQVPLISIEGAGRRPVAMTVDSSIAEAQAVGTATYPAGKDAAGNSLAYRMQLLLSYGVNYGTTGFRCDTIAVDVGQRVTVPANILYVSAIMLAPPVGYLSGSASVGAVVGLHGTPSMSPVICTQYVDSLAPGAASAPLILPGKRSLLLPIQTTDVVNFFQIDFQDQSGAPVSSLQLSAGQMVTGLPVSGPEYYQLVVTNKSLTTTASYKLPYQLAL